MSKLDGYHVKINGKGYILQDESAAVQSQQPYTPRFSTGDPGFGDLSPFQFLYQDNFAGGEGQEILSDLTKYKESCGFDMRDGKPRISFPSKDAGLDTLVDSLEAPTNVVTKLIRFKQTLILVAESSENDNDASALNSPVAGGGWTVQG